MIKQSDAKPIIVRVRGNWQCFTEYFQGVGTTPRAAYMNWLAARKGFKRV